MDRKIRRVAERRTAAAWAGLCVGGVLVGCGSSSKGTDAGGGDVGGGSGPVSSIPLVVSTATRTARTTTWSVNYWQWPVSYGDGVSGTEALVAPLKPTLMRIGGYNNDANIPDPFDDGALDQAVAYARAIGAEPLLQVPLLGDSAGQPPTAATAAAMVSYANVSKGYHLSYFAIGNEPDLYATQGALSNSTLPAIPNYTPTDYCTQAREFASAMKAVDPTIHIVGPDLSWKYQAGDRDNDWLTPILSQCGDLFDVIAIHRYPFDASRVSLAGAQADPAAFRAVIGQVRGILQATGQAQKPLALTEMNIVYNDTHCVVPGSPGTTVAGLWLADSIGAASQLGLWTTAVWDIADTDDWALGLLAMPPNHTPRPAYYAYALYADHFGPTLVNVTAAPPGVSAYATRNESDDATQVIAVNWNKSAVGVAAEVADLPVPPASTTFVLPPLSMTAIEIPDQGPASAWVYGETQRQKSSGPESLPANAPYPGDPTGSGGAGKTVGAGCAGDGGFVCPATVLTSPSITTLGVTKSSSMAFGSGTFQWGSYTYAAPGQPSPVAAVSSDGNGIRIQATFVGPVDPSKNWEGVGLYFNSGNCLDVSAYTGVQFDLTGDLGGCGLALGVSDSEHVTPSEDVSRGGCPGTESTCYCSSAAVISAGTTIKVPFASLSGGSPVTPLDPKSLINVQWQFTGPTSSGAGCATDFTVSNVVFY